MADPALPPLIEAGAMTHDPLCPYRPAPPEEYAPFEVTVACQCDLIAKADERGATRALDKARDAVAALIHNNMCDCESCWWKADALDAVNALRGKP